jgi:hypothetical protein
VRSASLISKMRISASGFEGFRVLAEDASLLANSECLDSALTIQKKSAAKFRRQKFSRQYSVNLLANDAGIIFRQSKASLMLLL